MSRAPGDEARGARIVALFRAGMARAAIADRLGCSYAAVASCLRRAGLSTPRPPAGRAREILRLRRDGLSFGEIALKLACPRGTVARVVHEAGLSHASRRHIGRRCDAWSAAA